MVQICGMGEDFDKHPHISQQKIHGTVSFGSKYGAKDSHSPIPILPLPLPTTRKQRARKKKFQRPISQRDLSLFYFERNFFFSYPHREHSKQRAYPFLPEFYFLPIMRKQQAKGFSIFTRIFFLTHNKKVASKGLFPHF
jgi:hypothetical protein